MTPSNSRVRLARLHLLDVSSNRRYMDVVMSMRDSALTVRMYGATGLPHSVANIGMEETDFPAYVSQGKDMRWNVGMVIANIQSALVGHAHITKTERICKASYWGAEAEVPVLEAVWANPDEVSPQESGIYYVQVSTPAVDHDVDVMHVSIDKGGEITGESNMGYDWGEVNYYWSEALPESPQ